MIEVGQTGGAADAVGGGGRHADADRFPHGGEARTVGVLHEGEAGVAAVLRGAGCVFAEEEAAILIEAAGGDREELGRLVGERVAGHPLEHIVGWAEFAGLRIVVAPGVFVPRRRTELLVRAAIREAREGVIVVDLCCGSGAIGAAIAAFGEGRIRLATDDEGDPVLVGDATVTGNRGRGFEVYAADVDPAAVASARRNLPAERVFEGDLFGALPEQLRGRVDVLVVNAPYVPSAAIALMPTEARLYEAGVALDGGDDGLDVQRRIVAGAREWLAPGGRLLIETSEDQAPLTAGLFEAAGLHPRVERDESLDGTVVVGRA